MANTKITSRVLADDAVLTANITDANVTTAKIAADAITGAKIADDVALGGNPTTTTQTSGNNTTRIATTAFVTTAIAAISTSSAADDISTGDAAVTLATTAGNITIDAQGSDTDIIFKGTDGSSDITALTLDMSEAGAATFNDKVIADAGIDIDNINIDGTTINLSSGDLTINAANDLILTATDIRPRTDLFVLNNAANNKNQIVVQSGAVKLFYDGAEQLETVSGAVYINNELGIGTTSPASPLHIKTSTNHNLEFEETSGDVRISALNDARDANIRLEFAASEYEFYTGNVSMSNLYVADDIGHSGDSNTYMSFENDFLGFYTGGTGTLFMNTGKVSVGSTQVNVTNAILTVDGGDMMVHGANNSAGISDLLAGYTRGDYGTFYSTANHIYFVVGSSYVGYISGSSGQYNVSDERLKENVATLTGTLDKVKQLRGVSYTWKDTEEKGTDTNLGMIAQEVETVYPELVGDGGLPNDNAGNAPYKSINYAHLTSVLVEAVKELSTKLEAAEARIKTLEDA